MDLLLYIWVKVGDIVVIVVNVEKIFVIIVTYKVLVM
jgi:hypothetical protein